MNKRAKKGLSLQASLYILILLCWVLPLVGSIVLFNTQLEQNTRRQVAATIESSAESAVNVVAERIETMMFDSRAASYEGSMRSAYLTYQRTGNAAALYRACNKYMQNTYGDNVSYDATFLLFPEDADLTVYVPYRMLADKSGVMQEFHRDAAQHVLSAAGSLGTGIEFLLLGDALYMIRNLVTPNYQPFAVLAMRCNTAHLLSSLETIVFLEQAELQLDGLSLSINDSTCGTLPLGLYYDNISQSFSYGISAELPEHTLRASIVASGALLTEELNTFHRSLVFAVLICAFLFGAMLIFFYRTITRPMNNLIEATEHLEHGELGYHTKEIPSTHEFRNLTEHFNALSDQLREYFDRTAHEQALLQDARIKALQSQINPHFLNNTLEMINWKARMSGDDQVSEMIEALSVMLNAAMARGGKATVSMKDEYSYIKAYLYIISQRLGERLSVEECIEPQAWSAEVPRLILQPIVENAVEHGIALLPRGTLSIHIYREGEFLLMDVTSDGKITPADQAAIDTLLAWDGAPPTQTGAARIGIRNVNERLKILYGAQCGLSITEPVEGKVLNRIRLPYLTAE